MLLRITASAFNDRGPLYMEQALSAVQQGMREQDTLTLTLLRDGDAVALTCDVPPTLRPLVTTQVLAHYPTAQIERCEAEGTTGLDRWSAELSLRPEVFALKRHPQFIDAPSQGTADPLSGILAALAGLEHDPLRPRVDFVVRAPPRMLACAARRRFSVISRVPASQPIRLAASGICTWPSPIAGIGVFGRGG